MKKQIIVLTLFLSIFLIAGCEAANNSVVTSGNSYSVNQTECPSLRIVTNYSGYIYRVGLVGYAFEDLRMEAGEEKTFKLIHGIPGGNANVNVTITFRPNDNQITTASPASIKCNFQNGKTTTVTLTSSSTLTVSD